MACSRAACRLCWLWPREPSVGGRPDHGRLEGGGARDPRRRRGGRRRGDQEGVPQGRAAHAPRQEQGRPGRQGQIPARRRGVQVPDRSELRRRRGRRDRGGAVHADGGDVRGVLRAAAHDVAPLGDPAAAARTRQDDDDEVRVRVRVGGWAATSPGEGSARSSERTCPRARLEGRVVARARARALARSAAG